MPDTGRVSSPALPLGAPFDGEAAHTSIPRGRTGPAARRACSTAPLSATAGQGGERLGGRCGAPFLRGQATWLLEDIGFGLGCC